MNPEMVKDTYRRMIDDIGETILIRRYTGSGANRPRFDTSVRAKVSDYEDKELLGGIIQGDQKVIVLVEDLVSRQFAMPILASDKVVVRGKELAIMSPDNNTARHGVVLIAYLLQCRG